jgi:excinuclease ABC subunit C
MAVIEGRRVKIEREIEKDMKRAAKQQDLELAAKLRNQLFLLQNLTRQVIFSDKEFLDISKDHALTELVNMLSIENYPRRIEGYDISHMSGTNVVASMVVFTNGVSDKREYRKFKTKINHNNDFYNMHETLSRRFSDKNVKGWTRPDLVLIDGGKGQLDAALRARDEQGQSQVPFIGLAKREEQIVIAKGRSGVTLNDQDLHLLGGLATESDDFILVNLPHSTNLVKLLQRIRDESHRFAVSYHSVLKQKGQVASMLDDIPGVGPATRKKLLKTFGSMRGIKQASLNDLVAVVGVAKATLLAKHL